MLGSTTLLETSMRSHLKLTVAIAAFALVGAAVAQTTTDNRPNTDRSAAQATRDAANAVGRAASAAVTPGDQNMGRNPENRTGGLMGNDPTANGSTASGSSATGSAATDRRRAARNDRG